MMPIVMKLVRNAAYEGHSSTSSGDSMDPGVPCGTRSSRARSVIAIAKTPSLNASTRAVSLCSLLASSSTRSVRGRDHSELYHREEHIEHAPVRADLAFVVEAADVRGVRGEPLVRG